MFFNVFSLTTPLIMNHAINILFVFKQCALKVQENGYKQYLKSRPIANGHSVKAAKNIRLIHPVLAIHPIFSKTVSIKSQ